MKRVVSFILIALLLANSSISFSAPGDFIHIGLKKGYNMKNADDRTALINALKDPKIDKNLFYREIEGGKYINIVEEESKQQEKLISILKSKGVDTNDPKAIEKYLTDPKNAAAIQEIEKELAKVTTDNAKSFEEIGDENKGYIEDYFKDIYAARLKMPANYSNPVPGSKDNTTKIANLTFPSGAGATRWIVKVSDVAFGPFEINTIITDGKPYNSGTDIEVKADKYLLLAAVDNNNRIKAYASIKITEDMVKAPKIEAVRDENITVTLEKAPTKSGSTMVSGLTGNWKLAVLDNIPNKVYQTDKFASEDYVDKIELRVVSDEELDNMTSEFKKYIIAYSITNDNKIDRYNIFEVTSDKVSPAYNAKELVEGTNFSLPVKGNTAGTTKIEKLTGLEEFGAVKWMYIVGNDLPIPLLDRAIENSVNYTAGEDITIGIGQDLLILATDTNGKVKAYAKFKEITEDKIKNPLAEELKKTTHYTEPVKGTNIGTTSFGFLKYAGIVSWKYEVSYEPISAPELNSKLEAGKSIDLVLEKDSANNIEIESYIEKLKSDNGFKKYLIIYGLDKDGKVKVFKRFDMNDTNVRMPKADSLEVGRNYSEPIKGSAPNTTRISTLASTGLGNVYFRYKVIDEASKEIEYNEKIDGIRELRANVDIPTTVGKHLLILAVDSSNKTKAYAIIPLKFENVKAGNAAWLQPTTNYQGPVPGDKNESTKFTFLSLPSGAEKWVYKIGAASFGIPETGADITDDVNYKEYKPYGDIEGVSSGDYLMLVAVDNDNKIIAYREFGLNDNEVKGKVAPELNPQAYSLMKGDNPSTTKLKLEPLGLENPTSIIWRYKLVDSEPSSDNEKPYLNQIIQDSITYTLNNSTKIGPDITVSKVDGSYGYILLLATDYSAKTKAYKYIKIEKADVKEHAPEIENVTLAEGTLIDSVKFVDLPTSGGEIYKYLISSIKPATPAVGDTLPSDAVDYTGDDIVIQVGKYLTIYEVDSSNKITAYKTFQVNSVKQGTASMSSETFLEGNIKNGGSSFNVTLSDGATWIDDIENNKSIRDKLFNGFKADKETTEWAKVVAAMIADGRGAINKLDDKNIKILLPQTLNYDIKEEQRITLNIPYEAIKGAINSISAAGSIIIKPTVGATISGDVVSSIVRESDIKAGGKTIVIELVDGVWSTDVSGIIDGFSGGSNWDLIKTAIKPENIVRNSGTKVTITLPPVKDVDFGITKETISLTIPKSSGLIQDATEDVIASPSFTLYPDILQVKGEAVKDSSNDDIPVVLMAPDYRAVDTNNDSWTIKVIVGTLKETITSNDVIISGLPKGLTTNVSKTSSDTITIKVSGTASATLTSDLDIKIKVKGTAVTEPASVDSDDISFKLIRGESLIEDLKKVKVNVLGKTLIGDKLEKMEYSLDSTNGTNGTWYAATATNIEFKPGKVYVREKANPRVFHLVATLNYGKAPTSIVMSSVDYEGGLKVELSGFETDKFYDYSVDGGNSWSELDISKKIDLTKDSDLRVRYRATEDSLPSLATAKLNGLYLGNITLNVGEGKIIGTTTGMEYSLNSGETYTTAKANETQVSFIKDETVIVREKAKPFNSRTIGTVGIMEKPNKDKVSFDIEKGTITDEDKRGLQYRIDSDSWKDLSATDESTKVDFKSGKLEIRAKGTVDKLPSEPVELEIIANPASAPELRIDDYKKEISYWNGSEWKSLEEESTLEYKVNDGSWKSSESWNPKDIENENAKVSVRFKATKDKLPSLIKVINFTGNLTFENVKLNVAEGKIVGTTTAMQYSVDSADGLNGTWFDAKANSTTVSFTQGMKVFIREKSKPLNYAKLSDGIGIEPTIGIDDVAYSIVNHSITNDTSRVLEYRIGADPWKSIDRKSSLYGVEFKEGVLQIRAKATENTLPSTPISITIKSRVSAPQLKYDDVKYSIDKIGTTEGVVYEYNINGGAWISGDKDTQFEGGDVVLVRLKATDDTLPSLEQKITFTKNLDLGNVIINAGKLQLENTSTLMEYSLDSTNGEDGLWFSCTAPNTKIELKENMTVYIREKSKPRNFREVTENPITTKDFPIGKSGEEFVNNHIDYDVQKRTISIKDVVADNKDTLQNIVNNLQYRIGSGNWINVDYVDLIAGETKTLVFNVDFAPGNLEFRLRGSENELPSKSFFKATILAPASAPNVSVGFDVVNYRNIVKGDKTNLEYSFNPSGPWIDGKHLDTEDLVGNVYLRVKANNDTLPSLVKTLEFKPVLNLKTINLSKHVTPLELNGTTKQMEYRVNNGIWQSCDDGNTKIKRNDGKTYLNDINDVNIIEIRDKNQTENIVIVFPNNN